MGLHIDNISMPGGMSACARKAYELQMWNECFKDCPFKAVCLSNDNDPDILHREGYKGLKRYCQTLLDKRLVTGWSPYHYSVCLSPNEVLDENDWYFVNLGLPVGTFYYHFTKRLDFCIKGDAAYYPKTTRDVSSCTVIFLHVRGFIKEISFNRHNGILLAFSKLPESHLELQKVVSIVHKSIPESGTFYLTSRVNNIKYVYDFKKHYGGDWSYTSKCVNKCFPPNHRMFLWGICHWIQGNRNAAQGNSQKNLVDLLLLSIDIFDDRSDTQLQNERFTGVTLMSDETVAYFGDLQESMMNELIRLGHIDPNCSEEEMKRHRYKCADYNNLPFTEKCISNKSTAGLENCHFCWSIELRNLRIYVETSWNIWKWPFDKIEELINYLEVD